MGLRFVILKKIDGVDLEQLEYDENILQERLVNITLSNLPIPTIFKKKYTTDEISDSLNKSWDMLVHEFKQETVKLP